MSNEAETLIDSFGRSHTSMRISVTDRCNIRCVYCMPAGDIQFLPRREILTFEEISRVVDVAIGLGICKVRLTGGEPLVRRDLDQLIRLLSAKPALQDLALTTNGMLLEDLAQRLFDAGLKRLNISLDTLSEKTFERISRRTGLSKVLNGIAAARSAGFQDLRINALAIKDINEGEVLELAKFCRDHDLHLRFIEFMPLDAEKQWDVRQVITGESIRSRISESLCELLPAASDDPSQPATDFVYADGIQKVGFINTVSQPFCADCNRLRLTAEGQLRNCLFGTEHWDLRTPLRDGSSADRLRALFRSCVASKKPGHGIDDPSFIRPSKSMYQIGG
jgi:cyclic pyranopterin phosphate synthase